MSSFEGKECQDGETPFLCLNRFNVKFVKSNMRQIENYVKNVDET